LQTSIPETNKLDNAKLHESYTGQFDSNGRKNTPTKFILKDQCHY